MENKNENEKIELLLLDIKNIKIGLEKGQQKGAYTLDEAYVLFSAITKIHQIVESMKK